MKNKFLFYMFIFLSFSLYAREVTVFVLDNDMDIPLEGAEIRSWDGTAYTADQNGKAVIQAPPDRQVVIQAVYPGYDTKRIVITTSSDSFTVKLNLSGIMHGRELVIEADRPETSETKSGRSVAISDRDLSRTAEIGILEDVMSSVKLLPGVGYTGMFGAMPSIRGGDPGDLMASYDGFYLDNPYHWMGGISIFDPKMVSSARLSHGVFSARYGHTISGLLEIASKTPSSTDTELEAAIGTSAATLNLSIPFNGKGGILFMGKVTYWDAFFWAAQGLSRVVENETLDLINSVSTAPFIRSAALSMYYNLTSNTTWRLNAFFGSDGVGAELITDYDQNNEDEVSGIVETRADYGNYQGFLITGLTSSPASKLSLKLTTGIGFINTLTDAYLNNAVTVNYNDDFLDLFSSFTDEQKKMYGLTEKTYTAPNVNVEAIMKNSTVNAQLRADADYELGYGFIASLGIQELYSIWSQKADVSMNFLEYRVNDPDNPLPSYMDDYIIRNYPELKTVPNLRIVYNTGAQLPDIENKSLLSSAYGLIEYTTPGNRFGLEAGLRMDHLYFTGKNFTVQTMPAFNPRLNLDFTILKNSGFADSLSVTAGSGLFSSMPSLLSYFDPSEFKISNNSGIDGLKFKFNRSWTSVIGLKLDYLNNYSFNIEGYYKYIYDRAYITARFIGIDENEVKIEPTFNFDGIGNVWGIDFQLQKTESRYLDGWISYTYTVAKYKDPAFTDSGLGMGSNPLGNIDNSYEDWYYPSFHRFHNANLVLNIKPSHYFNIGIRFGIASGREITKVTYGEPYPYPVLVNNENGGYSIIQKYTRERLYEEKIRSAWSLPLDIKFMLFSYNKKGKVNMETYISGENLLSLLYSPTTDRTELNQYTGKTEQQASSANFEFPIPMISFGVKWRY